MALELYRTSKHNRLYREVLPDGSRRGYVTTTMGPMHYESEPDSGVYDTPIDMHLERVNNARLNGYRMTGDGWHYAIQTEPATGQQAPQGTVGFGGRQGAHWFRFRLRNVGYLHWPTRAADSLGGAPDYSTAPVITEKMRNLANVEGLADENHVAVSQVEWGPIWTTPGGGELNIEWILKAGKLKENIIINQAAREWLQANRPPSTPHSETYFGFRFELDVSDIPRAYKNGIRQSFDDLDDGDGSIELSDDVDRLLAFMPLDFVYAKNKGGTRPLRKRIYRSGGNVYLYVGVRVDELQGLLPGDLVFDPTMTQEAIAATADDGYETGNSMDITPNYDTACFCGVNGGTNYTGGVRFTPDLPQGASLTGGGSEFASLRLYGVSSNLYRHNGTPELLVEGDDQDNAPAWANGTGAERPNGSGFTATTASTAIEVTTDPGNGGQFMGANGIDVAGIVEEIVGRGGWSANNGMRFRIGPDSTPNGQYIAFEDFDGANTEARLDAYYTTAGGGGGGPNLLSLLGVG